MKVACDHLHRHIKVNAIGLQKGCAKFEVFLCAGAFFFLHDACSRQAVGTQVVAHDLRLGNRF